MYYPLVSVIVPVYNTEHFLRACLDSITGQTLRDIEIICINDGSTDASKSILAEYAQRDERIRIIDQQNMGLSEARNAGVRMAKGRYLSFVDSDDAVAPSALELCAESMERQKLDYLCFNATAFGEEAESAAVAEKKNRSYFSRSLNEGKVYKGPDLYVELKGSGNFNAPAWLCMISRALFIDAGCWFHSGILHEDEPWTFAVLMNASRCGCLNRCLYRYRIRSGSITQDNISFRKSYGLFAGAMDIQKILISRNDLMQDGNLRELASVHAKALIRNAIRCYHACSESEKLMRENLNPENKALFEQTVVSPASLIDSNDQQFRHH